MRRFALVYLTVAVLAGPATTLARGRTMSWRALEVDARLDDTGALHVRERQVIEFDGPWNGGERRFRVERGQRLRFERLSREGPDGRLLTLQRGDLDEVDRYDFVERHTLRWRSRSASAPPFARAVLVYVLEYTLSGVLRPLGDGAYRLDHDFAFPERDWPIEAARAALRLGPSWESAGPDPVVLEAGRLEPGRGLVGHVELRWIGQGSAPAADRAGLSAPARLTLGSLLLLAVVGAAVVVVLHGRSRGLFAPLPHPRAIDDAWLRENVFALRPEVVGAAWDASIGAPEVAAVLARLKLEGKIASRVIRAGWGPLGRDVLHLSLLVDRGELRGYERELVSSLFVDGATIDTNRLRAHYAKEGFDPSSRIASALRARTWALAPGGEEASWMPFLVAVLLLLAGAALATVHALRGGDEPPLVLTIHGAVWPVVAVVATAAWLRRKVTGFLLPSAVLLSILGGWGAAVLWLAGGGAGADGWSAAAHAAFFLGGVSLALGLARTPLGPEAIALRKRLIAARRHLARELAKPSPALEDAWIPYLVAFGLGPAVDRWFASHGPARTGSLATNGDGPAGMVPPGWSGGGGAFGGGGASGTWAALGGISSAIPSPSSGSSDSGGGGGGSSSGGGGGGGW